MKVIFRIILAAISFYSAQSFVKPWCMQPKIRSLIKSTSMTKHNFLDFAGESSVADKYFIIQSLLNHVLLKRSDLLLDYCYKNLNYTDALHIKVSSELESIVKTHYSSQNVLELYDIIKTSSYSKDCHIDVITLPLK